jgi:hypothetical protein
MVGGGALLGERLNFLNFIGLPMTFDIGSEYPRAACARRQAWGAR